MGIFFSAPPTNGYPAVERRRNNGIQPGLSIVAKDLTIAGDLQAEGIVRIEGRVVGNLHVSDQVLISEGGIVEGDVVAREVVVAGRVHGCINGEERVEVQSSAVVHGDITTRQLTIQEGGQVNGCVKMEVVAAAMVSAAVATVSGGVGVERG